MINKRVTSAVVMQNSARKERLFSQLISSTCCYISADGVVTGFHQTDQRAWSLCDTKAVKPVCVIARHFYLEFQQSYPIESLRDLKAVLAQQYPADCLHMIGDAQFGKRTVQTIQFKPELAQYLPVFAVLLPESVVIASAIEDDFFSARIDFGQSWFLARNAAGVCSRQSSPLLQDHFSFKLLAGVPEKTAEYAFDKATVPALLVAGLARLPLRTLPFRVKVRTQFASLPDWRQLLAATTLIVGSHMAATQAFLSWQLQATRSNIAALGADVDRLMTAQQQLQDVAASLGVLSNYSAQPASAIYYFELLKLCIEQHVTVRAIRLEQQQLLLSATATNAVEVLLLLQKQPWVESANFVSGTVKNDTGEQFSVRIMLKQGGLHE